MNYQKDVQGAVMSEITKLYENAGIKPTKNWQSCRNCKLKTETHYDDWGGEYLSCKRLERPKKCPDAKEFYPLFTAEKQIELIKFLMKHNEIHGEYNEGYGFSTLNYSGKYKKDFGESLASVINNELWQDLTEKEKQQVKGILE